MIVVNLLGGVGNQMFQYAAGRALAISKKQNLYLDISSFKTTHESITPRSFMLNCFNINAEVADEKLTLVHFKKANLLERVINKLKPYYKKSVYAHLEFQFDPNLFKAKNNVRLNGYWQSYLYFEKIKEIILNDFSLKDQYINEIEASLILINNSQSVSIHIRRGDYVTNQLASEVLGCLPISYYVHAIQFLEHRIKNPHYYIFSDDPEWVKANMNIQNSTIINSNNEAQDLILMSHCKHNIIANSSFSWWAAWLNNNTNKIVITPKKWFNDSTINTNDLIPPTWIRL